MWTVAKRKDGESIFADGEFEALKKTALNMDPEFWENAQVLKERVSTLKKEIESMLKGLDGLDEAGKFMPELNFTARMAGEPEYFFTQTEENHIAIYVSSGWDNKNLVRKSLEKVLEILIDSQKVKLKFYSQTSELLKQIQKGKVYGIIAIQDQKNYSLESVIRHDLKNQPDWDYDSAQAYTLPPCFDLAPPHEITEIIRIIFELTQGEYEEPSSYGEDFSLKEALPHLLAHMNVPVSRKVKIAVMDDEPKAVMGIITILQAWPEVELLFANQDRESEEPFHLPADSDIILLDEDMGNIKGSQVARKMEAEENFSGVIASISGERPEYFPAELHFQLKTIIEKHYEAAKDFVHFINRLLVKAGI